MIMTEWKTYKIGDIGKVITGKTPKTTIAENYGGAIPFLTPSDDLSSKYAPQTTKTLTERGLSEVKNCLLPSNAICVSCIGSDLGKVVKIVKPSVTNQQFNSIIPSSDFDADFVYYLMTIVGKQLNYLSKTSTAVPIINKTQFSNFEVCIPPLEEQRRIAGILGAIDDKIENNRRINDNLEQQAKALYKQWFVDNRSDNWEEKPLSEIVFFQEGPGIRNWQYVEKKGVRFINIRCINDGDVNVQNANMISEDEACGKYAHFLLEPLDIVMSCSGTLGRYAIIRQEHLPLCLNTSVIRFRPAQCIEDYSFVYGYLSSAEFLNKQEEMACGSVQANFGPTHLKQIKIKVPPKDYRMKYNNVVMPIINTMLKNRSEINMLSSLRDTLLPKLMNGEIKV